MKWRVNDDSTNISLYRTDNRHSADQHDPDRTVGYVEKIGGRVMNIGMARAIFENLENCGQPIEVKGIAIRKVIDMETHNSVTKDQMIKAMDWMWNQIVELKQEDE